MIPSINIHSKNMFDDHRHLLMIISDNSMWKLFLQIRNTKKNQKGDIMNNGMQTIVPAMMRKKFWPHIKKSSINSRENLYKTK